MAVSRPFRVENPALKIDLTTASTAASAAHSAALPTATGPDLRGDWMADRARGAS